MNLEKFWIPNIILITQSRAGIQFLWGIMGIICYND